jgi:hypothetical protein
MREYECVVRRVVLRPVVQTATLLVEAESAEDAEAQAVSRLEQDQDLFWQDRQEEPEEVDDCEVVSVEEAEGIDLAATDL